MIKIKMCNYLDMINKVTLILNDFMNANKLQHETLFNNLYFC